MQKITHHNLTNQLQRKFYIFRYSIYLLIIIYLVLIYSPTAYQIILKKNSSNSSVSTTNRGKTSNLIINNNQPDSYTKLLLHGKGTDASTTILDSSVSPSPKTSTVIEQTQIDDAEFKFDSTSIKFDGTGDYLSFLDSDDWAFGTSNFTVDTWLKFNVLPADGSSQNIFSQYSDSANNQYLSIYRSGANYYAQYRVYSSSSCIISVNNQITIEANIWYHLAFVRSGSDFLMFLNGTQVGSTVVDSDTIPNYSATLHISAWSTMNNFNGWLDEFRISKGTNRSWTTNFSYPTSEYSGYPQYQVDSNADSVVLYNGLTTKEVRDVDLTTDITVSGANGLETSNSEAANTWYYLWVINNGSTTAGLLSASSTSPTMPSGYTYKKLISAVRNDASSNFLGFNQANDQYYFTYPIKVSDNGGSTSTTTISSLSSAVPADELTKGVFGKAMANGTTYWYFNPTTMSNSISSADNTTAGGQIYFSASGVTYPWNIPVLSEEQAIYHQTSASTVDVWVDGFSIGF